MAVILVTGASSGIGRSTAAELTHRGQRVYGASRTAAPLPCASLRMDVDDEASVAEAVGEVLAREQRLDAVVNAAGFGIAGAVEDTSVEEARSQFETNIFGVLRVCRAVLPVFRRQGSGLIVNVSSIAGRIVNVSSIAGRVGLPFQALYAASKFALEGLTEALRMEVLSFGIRVVLVEPGDFATGFTDRRRQTAASATNPAYRERFSKAMAVIEKDERGAAPPEAVARLIARIIARRGPRLRYTVGPGLQRATPLLKALLPHALFERLIAGHYRAR
jgi:NAD(P)-dependent dehydrogenase (short-subunit alcohol dehydrogenase family)